MAISAWLFTQLTLAAWLITTAGFVIVSIIILWNAQRQAKFVGDFIRNVALELAPLMPSDVTTEDIKMALSYMK